MTPRRSVAALPIAAVMVGTTFVAVTAFVLAYDGSRGAATDAGIAQAGWYPFCIEGVIVCASVATLRLRRRFYPWVILLAFSAVSVAANVLHAWEQPGWMWWSLAFAAVPPLALPICVHLLLMVGRGQASPTKEERNGEADEGREGRGAAGVPGGAAGARREQGQDGDGQVLAGEPAGDRRGEGRPLVSPVALTAMDAGGLGSPVPGPSARDPDDLDGAINEVPIKVNGNGHGPTKTDRAVGAIAAYEAAHGRRPSISQLATLAGCSPGTAQIALKRTEPIKA